MTESNRPLVKGGQGRDGDRLADELEIWGGIAIALILILLCGVVLR
jgi:hypothetical protein